MQDNKVSGPEDNMVSEMIKQLPLRFFYMSAKSFQERFMGREKAPNIWKIVNLLFLRKPDAEPKKGNKSYTAIALTSVLSKWQV